MSDTEAPHESEPVANESEPLAKHARPFPPRWLRFIFGCVVLIGVLISVGLQLQAQSDRQVAQDNQATMSAEIKRVCATNGTLMYEDQDLCLKAAQVQENPTQAIPGPKGDPGKNGIDGADSIVPGPSGPPGKDGTDSVVPGPAGTDGKSIQGLPGISGVDGVDSSVPGPPGPAGKDGTDGAPGPTGLTGASGRGIADVQCVGDGDDSYWQITYTDGTTAQSSGPCKVETPPEPTPTPTP